jgi:RNA polymerase sigma-70 factor (ECF subfamily)
MSSSAAQPSYDPTSQARGFPPTELLITRDLVVRAQAGDDRAMNELMSRYLPRLERWASGRLPRYARSLLDTGDLVQETLLRVVQGLRQQEAGPGFFQAYVRQAVLNRIRDQIRWARRRTGSIEVPESLPDLRPSPLEQAIGADVLARYERALEALTDDERQFVHLRIELDFEYDEIAAVMGRPSRDAARMSVRRALTKMAEIMGHER